MHFPPTPVMIGIPNICAEFETRRAALPGCFALFFVFMKGGFTTMDRNQLLDLLAAGPVIAAVKGEDGLTAALDSDVSVIFLLSGDVLTIPDAAARVKKAGKRAFVHLDLVDGLASREVSVDFIARQTAADGIISTKAGLTRRGRELGLVSIQRFFLLDSMALDNIQRQRAQDCDLIEVLPGLMPKIIHRVGQLTGKPVIAGGLISDKEDVTAALSAGAVAVSTTNPAVWRM